MRSEFVLLNSPSGITEPSREGRDFVTIDPAAGDPRAQAPVLGHFGGGFSAKLSLGTNMTRPYLWMFMVEISVLNGVYKFYKPRNISLGGHHLLENKSCEAVSCPNTYKVGALGT